MKLLGLIGFPLSHSFSKSYFSNKFSTENITDFLYDNFPIENIDQLPELIDKNQGLIGFNVTIPYKEKVIKYLDIIDDTAREVGAVNTVKITKKGKTELIGYNTDVFGFYNTLQPLLKPHHKKAIILGTGGASKAIKYVLRQLNITFISASIEELHENEVRYAQIDKNLIENHTIIINATPLGTYPNINSYPPIPYQYISSRHLLYDLVYNPPESQFLKFGIEKGAIITNGLKMLHLQADRAWEIWNEQ